MSLEVHLPIYLGVAWLVPEGKVPGAGTGPFPPPPAPHSGAVVQPRNIPHVFSIGPKCKPEE